MTTEQTQVKRSPKAPELYSGVQEPNLADLYNDPTLHAVMLRDGIQLAKLMDVIDSAQKRLAA